jgi:hypothetical protein
MATVAVSRVLICPPYTAEASEPAPEMRRGEELNERRPERESRGRANPAPERLAGLGHAIESEIVPRLLMSLAASRRALASLSRDGPGPIPEDVNELARLLLGRDAMAPSGFVRRLREGGMPLERICLELFAPAAHRLSELWEQDQCTFMQFTVGLSRLYAVLQQLHTSAE